MTRSLSLHTKVLFIAIGILVLLFSLGYYYFAVNMGHDHMESRIEAKETYLRQLIELSVQRYAALGNVEACKGELRVYLLDPDVASVTVRTQGKTIQVSKGPRGNSPSDVIERAHELRGGALKPVGTIELRFWRDRDFVESPKIRILNAIIVIDLIVLSVLVFHLLIKEIVTQPLWQFIDATRDVAQGKLDRTLRLSGGSQEEEILAESFNEMVKKLAISQEELRDANLFLEQRVNERTRQLQASHSFTEAVIATVQEGIYVVDENKRITTFNQGAERITGLKASEVIGRPCHEVMNFPFCQKKCILDRIHQGPRTGEIQEELLDEMQQRARSWVITGGTFERPAGDESRGFPGGVETIKDISNMIRLQHQLRQYDKLSSLGTLTAGIAHELNNPLSNIKMFAQLLEESLDASRRGDNVESVEVRNIVEQADRASAIVKKMLEFSGGHLTEFTPTSILDVIHKSLDMVKYMVGNVQVEFVVSASESLPELLGNRVSLQQVMINLFTNALQSMGPRGGRLHVEVRHDGGRGQIMVRVSDTGPGIDPALINRIFDPFFTTKGVGAGTGLGLSISYGIVKDHKGDITVESKKGEGATFVLTFPVLARVAGVVPLAPVESLVVG